MDSPHVICLRVDVNFNTAVSVEWSAGYASWRTGSSPDDDKYYTSCLATKRSSNFDITEKLEPGLYDRTSAGSMLAFFSSGVM